MIRKRFVPSSVLALVLALGLGVMSCEGPAPVEPEANQQPSAGLIGDLLEVTTEVTKVVLGTDGEEYTLVTDVLPAPVDETRVSRSIDSDGGTLSLAGHRLTVPRNAVDEPTRFTMELVADGFVEVDLKATRKAGGLLGLLGGVEDVGTEEDPFLKPVTLTLRYARSPDVTDEVERKLINMRLLGDDHDDLHEPLESEVDTRAQTVTSRLDHFTAYCVAY